GTSKGADRSYLELFQQQRGAAGLAERPARCWAHWRRRRIRSVQNDQTGMKSSARRRNDERGCRTRLAHLSHNIAMCSFPTTNQVLIVSFGHRRGPQHFSREILKLLLG